MARLARTELVDPAEVAVFHCINRGVRRACLCGFIAATCPIATRSPRAMGPEPWRGWASAARPG